LLLTAVVTPKLGGTPMLRRLRRSAAEFSIVVMTAHDDDAREALELRPEERFVLSRPFMIAQLRERVAAALAWKNASRS